MDSSDGDNELLRCPTCRVPLPKVRSNLLTPLNTLLTLLNNLLTPLNTLLTLLKNLLTPLNTLLTPLNNLLTPLLRCPTCRVPLPKFMAPQDSMQLDDQAGTGSTSTVVVTGEALIGCL